MIPEMEGKCFVGAAQDRDRVLFEGLDGLLGNVVSMIVGGHELIFHAVGFDFVFEVLQAFVVKDMQLGENEGFC